jgi:hypothetical protein
VSCPVALCRVVHLEAILGLIFTKTVTINMYHNHDVGKGAPNWTIKIALQVQWFTSIVTAIWENKKEYGLNTRVQGQPGQHRLQVKRKERRLCSTTYLAGMSRFLPIGRHKNFLHLEGKAKTLKRVLYLCLYYEEK